MAPVICALGLCLHNGCSILRDHAESPDICRRDAGTKSRIKRRRASEMYKTQHRQPDAKRRDASSDAGTRFRIKQIANSGRSKT